MNLMNRRDFFKALAASALAIGVLPVGFPRDLSDADQGPSWTRMEFDGQIWFVPVFR
jgi:hypothetical protein